MTADDGVRLYVDGVQVIDRWIDQGPTTYRTTLPLDGGPHAIVMEYYENGGGAVARLSYAAVGGPPTDGGYQGAVLEHARCHRHPHHPEQRRPISFAPTRRSTSTGARGLLPPASRRTISWRAGRSPWCCRLASTASPAVATTACVSTSTTCPSPTGGRSATRTRASTGLSRAVPTSCGSSSSRAVAVPGPSSTTSGWATSSPATAGTPPSTSPTGTCRARPC